MTENQIKIIEELIKERNYQKAETLLNKLLQVVPDDWQGKLLLGGKEYSIHGGETFVIYPQELAFYEADANNPWRYLWVIFEGPKAEEILRLAGITEEQPMFYPNDRGTEVLSCMERLLYWRSSFTLTRTLSGVAPRF